MSEKSMHYFSDEIIGGPKKGSGRKKTYDPGGAGDLLIGHGRGLFDQDEDSGGDLIDPSTGKNYDNSTFLELEEPKKEKERRFGEIALIDRTDSSEDIYPPEQRDAIDAWIDAEEKRQAKQQHADQEQQAPAA